MPYIDLVDGKPQECQATDHLSKSREKDMSAILIEFLGYGADDPTAVRSGEDCSSALIVTK